MRIPGTPASAACTDEAHAMARGGRVELAPGLSLVTSVLGGMFGAPVLLTLGPTLADPALRFGSFEYLWLAAFGLVATIVLTSDGLIPGFISPFIGLSITRIGIDQITGVARFTGGFKALIAGLNTVPVLVGLHAVSEIVRPAAVQPATPGGSAPCSSAWGGQPADAGGPMRRATCWAHRWRRCRWISYALARCVPREKEAFGKGHPEGLVAVGAANNSANNGACVPTMVFGIPGDTRTAIVIGVRFVKGLNPGPTVFLNQLRSSARPSCRPCRQTCRCCRWGMWRSVPAATSCGGRAWR